MLSGYGKATGPSRQLLEVTELNIREFVAFDSGGKDGRNYKICHDELVGLLEESAESKKADFGSGPQVRVE
jgi:hypothetical protein